MAVFIAALLGGLVAAAGSFVGRILIALCVGYVTFTGVSYGIGLVQTEVVSTLGGYSGTVAQVLYLLRVDEIVSICFSAVAARLLLAGLSSGGAITRMVLK